MSNRTAAWRSILWAELEKKNKLIYVEFVWECFNLRHVVSSPLLFCSRFALLCVFLYIPWIALNVSTLRRQNGRPGVDGNTWAAGAAGRRQLLLLGFLGSWMFQFFVSRPALKLFFNNNNNKKLFLLLRWWRLRLPRGSLFKNTEGWRKTKCRYVLTFEQKAMKWIKNQDKTDKHTNKQEKRPNFIFVSEMFYC